MENPTIFALTIIFILLLFFEFIKIMYRLVKTKEPIYNNVEDDNQTSFKHSLKQRNVSRAKGFNFESSIKPKTSKEEPKKVSSSVIDANFKQQKNPEVAAIFDDGIKSGISVGISSDKTLSKTVDPLGISKVMNRYNLNPRLKRKIITLCFQRGLNAVDLQKIISKFSTQEELERYVDSKL